VSNPPKVFLSAEWLHLVMLNYSVDPGLLRSYVPPGTTLGFYAGKTYLSLVGFRFCKTKLCGKISVPWHSEFEEVNLRFYVHRNTGHETRRGVVFIKEIVPKPAIALTARVVYGENYVSLPMKHKIAVRADNVQIEYSWKHRGNWSGIHANACGSSKLPEENSLEQYITEHYWGYSRQKSGRALEYHVKHAPWQVWRASDARFERDITSLYGPELSDVLLRPPDSAHIAVGSAVEVYDGMLMD
jgi:uncharacterized protein